jgi:hypothetical protein
MILDDTHATVFRRMLALQTVAPFDRLSENELSLIAEVAEPRLASPGEIVHLGGAPLPSLWVTVDGGLVRDDGAAAERVNGLTALLGNVTTAELRAGPEGARILVLSKGCFFTLTRECPAFILGLLTGGHDPAASP